MTTRICAHCGRTMQGYASADGRWLCHPDEGMDCYRLVTVYKHSTPCAMCLKGEKNVDNLRQVLEDLDRRIFGD